MFAMRAGRGRVSGNPFVRADEETLERAGDTLSRILNSDAMRALLRILVLMFAANLALTATLAVTGG